MDDELALEGGDFSDVIKCDEINEECEMATDF